MLKFSFGREKDKGFKHIAHGLIPAASIAPKAAVPRTPPPRSPNPSPERPRSALAAAILSSSLTGQTWAIPPIRPRSFSEIDQSESFISEQNFNTTLFTRDRWSEDLTSRPHLSSPEHSEGEIEDREEEVENEGDGEEHANQTLDRQRNLIVSETQSSTAPQTRMSGRRLPSPDLTEGSSGQSPEIRRNRLSSRKNTDNWRDEVPSTLPTPTTGQPRRVKNPKQPPHKSPELSQMYSEVHKEKKTRMVVEQNILEERLQHLEQEISHSKASAKQKSPTGSQAELQNLRQHAQELVDENDALKLTVHRLNVELSRYQTRFRPLSKEESSKISGLPKTGFSPPSLLDMKYFCPLLLAYEDRMKEKDELLQTSEEEVKKLHTRVEEVVKENERLHGEIASMGVMSQKDCQQLQQQAYLVLQENQTLIDQLQAQHVKAKAIHSKHQSEVTKVSKQLMLLEAEKHRLQEDLEESRREVPKHVKEVQLLQTRLKDAITWDEHCEIAGKLRRQLEQQESRNNSEMEKLLLRVSNLQEENKSLAVDKANLTADLKTVKAELELCRQANRKAERKMSILRKQREDCVLKEENIRHYLGSVLSVAEHISKERDQLLNMAAVLQQEKQGFVSRIVNGTVRFGKLQEEVKVYRRQASTQLAALEEAVEGRTASYQREILHLQRLLSERREAEEKLLQSKREVEEELEVVWQAATRENQEMRKTLMDSKLAEDGWALHGNVSPGCSAQASNESPTSSHHQHKHGLDFYC
ncbi:centrosomal protein of 89 kDa isoform X2 [Melanotaenia boesemani]|uniref:centrosomal protein of 89 kDa isoform X2 n=1 Tax=Melanotaenia boesemani TaxID=1250792 RepID=UPI001C040DBB|nr:centrosomal protein of 89 kDa isoform X2 [Melanotaenia boesemani]